MSGLWSGVEESANPDWVESGVFPKCYSTFEVSPLSWMSRQQSGPESHEGPVRFWVIPLQYLLEVPSYWLGPLGNPVLNKYLAHQRNMK